MPPCLVGQSLNGKAAVGLNVPERWRRFWNPKEGPENSAQATKPAELGLSKHVWPHPTGERKRQSFQPSPLDLLRASGPTAWEVQDQFLSLLWTEGRWRARPPRHKMSWWKCDWQPQQESLTERGLSGLALHQPFQYLLLVGVRAQRDTGPNPETQCVPSLPSIPGVGLSGLLT